MSSSLFIYDSLIAYIEKKDNSRLNDSNFMDKMKLTTSKAADTVVVFPQAPFRVTNVPGQASAGIIQLRNCTMAP